MINPVTHHSPALSTLSTTSLSSHRLPHWCYPWSLGTCGSHPTWSLCFSSHRAPLGMERDRLWHSAQNLQMASWAPPEKRLKSGDNHKPPSDLSPQPTSLTPSFTTLPLSLSSPSSWFLGYFTNKGTNQEDLKILFSLTKISTGSSCL